MDAVKFLNARERMCKSYRSCEGCPEHRTRNGKDTSCLNLSKQFPEVEVAIVEKWAKKHPEKTYKDDFVEKFPKATLSSRGCPLVCRNTIYRGEGCKKPFPNCKPCWNEPMEV